MGIDLIDNFDSIIEEGPVSIAFARPEESDRVKCLFVIDFSKTDRSPSDAARIFKKICNILRAEFDVDLHDIK